MLECTEQEMKAILDDIDKCGAFFIYTPLCGTCKLSEKMLTVCLAMMPSLTIRKVHIHFIPHLRKELQIESVPCLIRFQNAKILDKTYALHSVQYLYSLLLCLKCGDKDEFK